MKKLTIIIPCYNEEAYAQRVLGRVLEVPLAHGLAKEILIVNDGSTDQTQQEIERFIQAHPGCPVQSIRLDRNRGKGYSIRRALSQATGDLVVIQDADLEYDPQDFNSMLQPILEGRADVVFGSRFRGSGPHRGPFILHAIVNKVYTFLSNLLTQQNLTDIHTCYKMYRTEVLRDIRIRENRFGIDPEIVAKLGHRKGTRIVEIGISYYGRTFSEGKKISWSDGIRAFYCIIRYNLFDRR
ncbi:MAG TPA: glycosyltransferase family 2 protein [Chitinophagaceae bacterium]|nr:glycosyltransferase family 2 protein [Chitinophagaceae bacterium]